MKLPSFLSWFALALSVASGSEIKSAKFSDASTETKWTLKELDADLPSDWSAYSYLTLELRSSTPQRFELRIFTTNGMRHVGHGSVLLKVRPLTAKPRSKLS